MRGRALPAPRHPDRLADRRYVTLLLRLVVDRDGRLLQGELVDLDGTLRGRFAKEQMLLEVLRACLAEPGPPAGG